MRSVFFVEGKEIQKKGRRKGEKKEIYFLLPHRTHGLMRKKVRVRAAVILSTKTFKGTFLNFRLQLEGKGRVYLPISERDAGKGGGSWSFLADGERGRGGLSSYPSFGNGG